ncbi:hypothetical protein [Glaciibacter psychrotolerans]|uniref:Uncharacterized protein n=1 Tax=Glaciibacter psychrotolerans TaxID=670054 RepID=A0A7Z0EDR2_9MICO|nr:hypothetical protein [Leifsonia psychrotolerans]NYJ19576.1 hypothetical protein [Leifsonia psychrotolerans]
MRRFIFNSAMLGVITGAWSVVQATRHGPRDWRLILIWVGWAASAAVAIGTVITEANRREIED